MSYLALLRRLIVPLAVRLMGSQSEWMNQTINSPVHWISDPMGEVVSDKTVAPAVLECELV